MSAPVRYVPHIYELTGIIVDMMHFDLVDAGPDGLDDLDDYVELLYEAIRNAKQQYIDETGGYVL